MRALASETVPVHPTTNTSACLTPTENPSRNIHELHDCGVALRTSAFILLVENIGAAKASVAAAARQKKCISLLSAVHPPLPSLFFLL